MRHCEFTLEECRAPAQCFAYCARSIEAGAFQLIGGGWISHEGGERPVTKDTMVEIFCRHELKEPHPICDPSPAGILRWGHANYGGDIIAYRVVL